MMVFDPVSVFALFAGIGVLIALPGTLYVRWLFPDLSPLEAIAAGYGLILTTLVGALSVANLGLGMPLTRDLVVAVYAGLVLPLSWPLSSGSLPPSRSAASMTSRPWITPRRVGLATLGLAILAVAAFWAGHSNLVRSYPYPHHVDSYIHWGNARAMQDHAGFPYGNWLTGEGTQGPTDETGFWYLLAALAWLLPISLTQVAMHGKLAFVAALALAAWAYGSRDGTPFGLEAALLVPLIPTTHRFLGPMFLVPMTVVLTLALGAGILARADDRSRAVPGVLLLGVGGLLIHSATSGVVALLGGWRLLLGARNRREYAWTIGAAALFAAGFLLVVLNVPYLHRYWNTMIGAWMQPQTVTKWGLSGGGAAYLREHLTWWPIPLFGLGVVAAFRGRRPAARSLVLSLPPILAIMVAYERWTRGFSSLYDRSFFYAGFLYLMLAAVGLAELRRVVVGCLRWMGSWFRPRIVGLAARWFRGRNTTSRSLRSILTRAIAPSTALVLASTAGVAVTAGGAAGLYGEVHAVKKSTFINTFPENETFERFFWIRDHPNQLRGADLGLVRPGHGNEFSAITGLYVYSHTSHPYLRVDTAPAIYNFYDRGCKPLAFLNETGAEIVVGGPCSNSHGYFEVLGDQIYLYEPALGPES